MIKNIKNKKGVILTGIILFILLICAAVVIIPASPNRVDGYDHVTVTMYKYVDGEFKNFDTDETFFYRDNTYCLHDKKDCYLYDCEYQENRYVSLNEINYYLQEIDLKRSETTQVINENVFFKNDDKFKGRKQLNYKVTQHIVYAENPEAAKDEDLDLVSWYIIDNLSEYFKINGAEPVKKSYTSTEENPITEVNLGTKFSYDLPDEGYILVCTFIDNPEKMLAPIAFAKNIWENKWYTPIVFSDIAKSHGSAGFKTINLAGVFGLVVISILLTISAIAVLYERRPKQSKFNIWKEIIYAIIALIIGALLSSFLMLPATAEMFLIAAKYTNHLMTYILAEIWVIGLIVILRWATFTPEDISNGVEKKRPKRRRRNIG